MIDTILPGDALTVLKTLSAESIHCCVTSPPYWGLRDYGITGQLGLEPTPEAYVANMVAVFREVRRVLREDGTCWVNLGDSYARQAGPEESKYATKNTLNVGQIAAYDAGAIPAKKNTPPPGLKPKDLVGIPWRVAFALQADGWWLRQDIIWCLSGGTWLYARTQKGDMPMTVKDVARLDPATVKLWNGQKWTQLLGMSKSERRGDELEIVMRSGERISCTPTHRFPSSRGLVNASELRAGDTLERCQLPEPETPRDCAIDEDAAWFSGLYIAEGSRSEDTIQISGHTKERKRWERIQRIAAKFGGYATMSADGNKQSIRVYGKVLNAIIDELVTGRTAHNKGFAPVVWRYSNRMVAAMVDGYLAGDGHDDGTRWRLGFCRNYNLERDLRTACARLGYVLTLNLSSVEYEGKTVPMFRGELRKRRTGHHNERDRNEIVEIRKARCRCVYDLGVADEPHLFSLASGVLTHNSKPNPMPESVTDRCTKAHEYIFLFTKSVRYFYDQTAIKEPLRKASKARLAQNIANQSGSKRVPNKTNGPMKAVCFGGAKGRLYNPEPGDPNWRNGKHQWGRDYIPTPDLMANKKSVWTVPTIGYKEAHFATFPPALIEPCILAGCPEGGTVLDPFMGAGTTGLVANRLDRHYVGIELNPAYIEMAQKRIYDDAPLFMEPPNVP